jgi:hypothetical protein
MQELCFGYLSSPLFLTGCFAMWGASRMLRDYR